MASPSTPFLCGNENRRARVRSATDPNGIPLLNGLDFLEVVSPDQRTLRLRFIHPLPGQPGGIPAAAPALGVDQLAVEGGVRLTGIRVLTVAAAGSELTVTVDAAGDFSPYTLVLRRSPTDPRPPVGFDPQLSRLVFSFKASCPSDFDCRPAAACEPAVPEPPRIDYQARDFASFRRLLLDRFRVLQPDWNESSPADFPVAMVELLAYVGDHLNYRLDVAATEQFLDLARQRPSLRRHARLRDYRMHEGCNARAWVQFDVEPASAADGALLPTGTPVVAGSEAQRQLAASGALGRLDLREAVVFETMAPLLLRPAHNAFTFHTWSDDDCTLCARATTATITRPPGASLAPGDVLVFEEVRDPESGPESRLEGRPQQRHPVRLTRVEPIVDPLDGTDLYRIEWATEDAPPFPFVLSRRIDGVLVPDITIARGNVMLADHGLTFEGTTELQPAQVPAGDARYRPRLRRSDLSYRQPIAAADWLALPARDLVLQTASAAHPALHLESDGEAWSALPDLLGSDENAPAFVVEVDNRRLATLRFGDGEHGRRPAVGQTFTARLRVGNGTAGNVGPETLQTAVFPGGGIRRVRNPLAASGGTDPEPLAEARQFAPVAFRTQKRAVTAEDYAEMAARYPGVQRAHAVFRHLASWYTVFVAVDRLGGIPLDAAFRAGLLRHLDGLRMAGCDLEIVEPIQVPLDIQLAVCLARGASRTDVVRLLAELLGRGPRGLFHPDRLTFGHCLYLSRLVAIAMSVPGVGSARVTRFQRYARPPAGELAAGFIQAAPQEILRLDNDPSFPEHGRLEFVFPGETAA